ncbi:MAG: hypothetical protein GXO86_09520 [Chlorobi bacterium]|nr:hypothetical protein [Chlorobiota bacterium]
MKNLFFVFVLFVVITSSCASQKVLNQYAGTQIVFGNGGGFTGQVNEYTLSTDGTITLVKSLEGDTVVISTVSRKTAGKIFSLLSDSGLDTLDFKHPGNRYYFIKERENGIKNEVIWGNPDYTVPAQIENLYTLLITNINNN